MKKRMYIVLGILAVIAIAAVVVLQHPAFGALPTGERFERIRQSANYRDGAFQNLEETPVLTGDKSMWEQLWSSLFNKPQNTSPKDSITAVKTDLSKLDLTKDQVVWFGHSSYLLVLGGKKILVDPVLTSEFPASLRMKPFKGTDTYTPRDIPAVDILIITHDHWDHLDYGTMRDIKDRVTHMIAPLGVGAHLEKWGYGDRLTELDWNDSTSIGDVKFTCLPARHYSGRLMKRSQSLWASFMVQTDGKTIFVGDDSGYGKHFTEIAKLFPNIDLAMLESGQYDKQWAKIHALPEEMPSLIKSLHPKKVVPIHNGKYALANHEWDDPMKQMKAMAKMDSALHVEMPTIGKPISID